MEPKRKDEPSGSGSCRPGGRSSHEVEHLEEGVVEAEDLVEGVVVDELLLEGVVGDEELEVEVEEGEDPLSARVSCSQAL